ncbi:MAG TPA: sigma-70 family RNA polymerase sigma factor [Gemmataceae bacterium]|nr:sigma-70 family RNA polymerase sigma factor [Gemmataceae bacterium]
MSSVSLTMPTELQPDASLDGELSDGQLLRRYVNAGDHEAFTVLVRRYAKLVYGVCRRALSDAHEAEDAFQATFLMLAAQAGSLETSRSLGGWLCIVARRTAVKARVQAARRRERERRVASVGVVVEQLPDDEWWPRLLRELQKLPGKYRLPLVLCYLHGKTHREAAEELGWPIGSMSRRVARALDLLRRRFQGAYP